MPNRPPGSTLDVKKSRHKKISKMLQVGGERGGGGRGRWLACVLSVCQIQAAKSTQPTVPYVRGTSQHNARRPPLKPPPNPHTPARAPAPQVYAKAGLLTGKEDKAGDFIVSGVNRGHELYEDFRPYKRPQQDGGGGGDAAAAGGGAASGGGGADAGGGSGELVIAELFKPTRELKRGSR